MTVDVDQQQLIDMSVDFERDQTSSAFLGDMIDIYVNKVSTIAPWWSRARDAALRNLWKDGNYGSALMNHAQTKLATIPMRIVARDKSIAAHVRQAENLTKAFHANSGFGAGWYQTMMAFNEDYLGQDNGGFMEIIGDGPKLGSIEGIPMAVRNLDASRCTRTGDPIYPILYQGDDSVLHKLHMSRVFFMSQMPSAKYNMFGVGFCSISRSLRILQNLTHLIDHKDEKMGARAASQILVGSGITGKEIIKAIAAAESMMDNLGLSHYARTIALGSTDGSVDLDKVDLNSIADFDEDTSYTFASYALALAWGLEFQEIIPITSNKASEIVSLQRGRARLPHLYRTAFMEQANLKLVPMHLELVLDYEDDQADQQRAVIEDITSRNFQRQMESGVTTVEVVQQIMHDRGYVSREQLRSMQLGRGVLQSGAPVQSIFFDPNYNNYLLVPRELLVTRMADEEFALTAIEANQVAIYEILGQRRSTDVLFKALESLAALEWLKDQYVPMMFEEVEEEEEEEEEEEANAPERRGVGEGGAEEKELYPTTTWFRGNHDLVWRDI